jgi:hypothetical protein
MPPVLLLLGHFYLYYRAGAILKAVVEKISDSKYSVRSKNFRIGYFPLRITSKKIELFPLQRYTQKRTYDVIADSLDLRLNGLLPILMNRIEVNQVMIAGPQIFMESEPDSFKRQSDERFYIPLSEIQSALLSGLQEFKVDRCVISRGSFSLVKRRTKEKFAINGIDIEIDSLSAGRKGMLRFGNDTLPGYFRLTLNNPEIVLPDSTLLVDVDRLHVDTKNNLFEIEELRFSRDKYTASTDTIRLLSLKIRGLKWKQFLQKGLVELDTVKINTGLAQLDWSERPANLPKKTSDQKQDTPFELPFMVHYISINSIRYQFTGRNKAGKFSIELDGDSLFARNFRVLDSLNPKMSVEALKLRVRNFVNLHDNLKFKNTFDGLVVQDKTLSLINLKMRPVNRVGFGSKNLLVFPSIQLTGYSLPQLLQGRFVANRIVLQSPKLVLDVFKVRDSSIRRKTEGNLFALLNRLQPLVDVNELDINDASMVLQSQKRGVGQIRLTNLNTSIDVDKLLSANSLRDLLSVSEGITTEGFLIDGPGFNFSVKEASISADARHFYIKKLLGTVGEKLELDLNEVSIAGKAGELPFPVDGLLELEKVAIGSGTVMLRQKDSAVPKADQGKAPDIFVDYLQTGNIQLTYFDRKGRGSTIEHLSLNSTNFEVSNKGVLWLAAALQAAGIKTAVGKYNLQANELKADFPGKVSIGQLQVWPTYTDSIGITAFVPALEFMNSAKAVSWHPQLISNVVIYRPEVRWKIGPVANPGIRITDSTKSPLPLWLNSLTIVDPQLAGGRLTKTGDLRKIALNGGRMAFTALELNPGTAVPVWVSGAQLLLPGPMAEINDQWLLKPKSLYAKASALQWSKDKGLAFMLDSMDLQAVGTLPLFNDTGKILRVGSFGLAGWQWPLPKDVKPIQLFTRGPNWWLRNGSFMLKDSLKHLEVYNLTAERNNLTVAMDSLMLLPLAPPADFFRRQAFEKDYIKLRLGVTKLQNVQPVDETGKGFAVDKLITQKAALYVARDKQVPDDTIKYRPLPAKQLLSLPLPLFLDTFMFAESSIVYEEVSDKNGLTGRLLLDSLEGKVVNIQTRADSRFGIADSLHLDVNGRLMQAAPFKLTYQQAYFDSMQHFRFHLDVDRWSLSGANQLLRPLVSVSFRRGISNDLQLWAIGNDSFARTITLFKYAKMRVGLLKNGQEDKYPFSGTINFMANLILRNNNENRQYFSYTERLRHKSIFNFWGKMLNESIQHTVGVPGKGKSSKKHLRQHKQAKAHIKPEH